MRLLLIGCEYAGKHTLGVEIDKWWCGMTGQEFRPPPSFAFHDHFVLPHVVHAEGHEYHKELSESQMLTLTTPTCWSTTSAISSSTSSPRAT